MSARSAVLAGLSLIGLLISVVLLVHDIEIHAGLQTRPSICSLNESFDCDKVARSAYSRFLGIPVASYAALFYFVLFGWGFVVCDGVRMTDEALIEVFSAAAILALLPTVGLFIVSAFVLETFCLYCTGLYIVNLGLVSVSLSSPLRKTGVFSTLTRGLRLLLSFFTLGFFPANSRLRASPQARFTVVVAAVVAVLLYQMPRLVVSFAEARKSEVARRGADHSQSWPAAKVAHSPDLVAGTLPPRVDIEPALPPGLR